MSPIPDQPAVVSPDGVEGYVDSEPTEVNGGDFQVLVYFNTGQRLWVPAQALILQENGTYKLQVPYRELENQAAHPTLHRRPDELDERMQAAGLDVTQPMVRDSVREDTETRPTESSTPEALPASPPPPAEPEPPTAHGVRLSKVVQAYREIVDEPLLHDDVSVDRVPVNEYIDEPPPIRYEDDRIIIPVVEEVLVTTKRLLLKENVVVTKKQVESREPAETVRRAETVVAEPRLGDDDVPDAPHERDQQHHAAHYNEDERAYERDAPAYNFGRSLRGVPRFQGWDWDSVEPEARALWEAHNPGTWPEVRGAVRHAWGDAQPA